MKDIVVGGRYRHYKGGIYKVLNIGLLEENMTHAIVYQSEKDGQIWIRTYFSWAEKVECSGVRIDRFALIDKDSSLIER